MRLPAWARRLILAAAALGASTAVVGAASFAIFSSAATPQTDSFAAGTVAIGNNGFTCSIPPLEAGDSTDGYPDGLGAQNYSPCVYQVQYSGSLPGWVALDTSVSSTTGSDETACAGGEYYSASATASSCQPLYNGQHPNSLNVAVCGTQPSALGGLPVSDACRDGGSPVGFGVGANQTLTYPDSYAYDIPSAQDVCTGQPGEPAACGPNETGAVVSGWTYDFVVEFFLPLTAGNAYQGGSATVHLQVHAVQASNNPLLPCPQSEVQDPNSGGSTPPYLGKTYGRVAFHYPEPNQPTNGWGTVAGSACPAGSAAIAPFYHPYS